MKRYTIAAAAAVLVLMPWHEALRAAAPHYTVENLGDVDLGAGVHEVPTIVGVNASGQVVGNAGGHAVRFTDGVGWQVLPNLGDFSNALGINDAGDVVGYHFTPEFQLRAFRYRDNHLPDDIEPLAVGGMTLGFGINNASDVVGQSDSVAFRAGLDALGMAQPAVALPSFGDNGLACGINATGQIAGIWTTSTGVQHGMRTDLNPPLSVDIASFDGPDRGTVTTCAIDGAGLVGGQSTRAGLVHAALFNGTALVDLDTFNSIESNVESIANGVAVGWYTVSSNTHRAFVYRSGDGTVDLNTLVDAPGWVLSQAKGVNQNGVIVGEGTDGTHPAVFRLTPESAGDSTPPVISSVTANGPSPFLPNGQMVGVSVTVAATDNSGAAPACALTDITVGGAATADASVTGPSTGSVKAVGGRTYTFNVRCVDASNNSATGSADLTVPADTVAPHINSVSASPSNLGAPDGRLVPVSLTVSATDDVDNAPLCSITNVSGDAEYTGPLSVKLRANAGQTYTLTVRCTDGAGNQSAPSSVSVAALPDTTAPVITSLSATPGSVWPPNGKMVGVSLAVTATDTVDPNPTCGLAAVTGAPASDYTIAGLSASVRATKDAVYELRVDCRDHSGNTSSSFVAVSVTKDGPAKAYGYLKKK